MQEWCASCSSQVDSLNEVTGWCVRCTLTHCAEQGLLLCSSCGGFFKRRGQFTVNCSTCDAVDWQRRNADRIERWMGAGLTYELARDKVREENRPTCLGCGRKIKHGSRTRHVFCRATPTCRTLARRVKWLRDYYGLSRDEAIERALAIQKEKDSIKKLISNIAA
jgi:hypothetical protein